MDDDRCHCCKGLRSHGHAWDCEYVETKTDAMMRLITSADDGSARKRWSDIMLQKLGLR